MVMDLNRFKEVNDTLGHRNGDLLLMEVAGRLLPLVGTGTLARLSGDEFAVLLPDTDEADTVAIAQEIGRALHEPFVIDDLTLEIGASIGVAMAPTHGSDADTLIRRADVAMYLAKDSDAVCQTYDPSRDEYSFDRLALVPQLRRAIQADELIVVYQPKVALETGRIEGAEALVRWPHAEHGVMSPDGFIPLAEHTGLIRLLTRAVMRRAVADCKQWRADGLPLSVAVNCSARDFATDALHAEIAGLLDEFELPPSALEVEITESAIMADAARAQELLRELTRAGVSIAVDDFGTGYSSLAYLRRLDVAQLKIDRSFVMAMTGDVKDFAVVQSVIELARNLGLKTVAEGVEDGETAISLSRLGCDYAQGYFYGKPMSARDLAAAARASIEDPESFARHAGEGSRASTSESSHESSDVSFVKLVRSPDSPRVTGERRRSSRRFPRRVEDTLAG
jgi:diguanylate cyclase (GGDEF)-like protein